MSLNKEQYGLRNLANQSLSIPLVDPRIKHTNNISTPEWMILMDTYLSSTIKKYELFAELYGWHAEQARLTKGSVKLTIKEGKLALSGLSRHKEALEPPQTRWCRRL